MACAALDAADGQLVLVTEPQAEFPGQGFDGGLGIDRGLWRRRLGQLTERFRQSNGRIGGNGPLSLEILLIHHYFRRLALVTPCPCRFLLFGSGRGLSPRGSPLGGYRRERWSTYRGPTLSGYR